MFDRDRERIDPANALRIAAVDRPNTFVVDLNSHSPLARSPPGSEKDTYRSSERAEAGGDPRSTTFAEPERNAQQCNRGQQCDADDDVAANAVRVKDVHVASVTRAASRRTASIACSRSAK